MKFLRTILCLLCTYSLAFFATAQRGSIIQAASTTVMDPNNDGYVSLTNAGFSNDGYYVDEFEISMFGIPYFGDGEALSDTQVGPSCGTTDLTVDTDGHSAYAVLDDDNNLIFRFRLAAERPSVEAYTILIDTDGKIGPSDPNYSETNPGFEIDITLIKNASQGITVYNIDGVSGCPTPLLAYDYSSHFQVAIADIASCGDQDYFYDFYVPFDDLTTAFGITTASKLQFAAVTNISGTCAMAGKISDIGGVNDDDYDGCNYCAFEDLASNQCPVSLDNLCSTCGGFLSGATPTPTMEVPLKEGDQMIQGTADPEAEVFIDIFSFDATLVESLVLDTDDNGNWIANLGLPLVQGDSVTAVAQVAGKCDSGASGSQLSFAVVVLNTAPFISGTGTPLPYAENDGAVAIDPGITVGDNEDLDLVSATVSISSGFSSAEDALGFMNQNGLTGTYNSSTGVLTITGDGTLAQYQQALQSVTYSNSSEDPSEATRTITFIINDGTEDSAPFERDINVSAVNDPPVISGTSGATAYLWASTLINNTMSITDVDDAEITGASISVGNNFIPNEDFLHFVTQNGITGSYDASTGILTLTGTASFADYATALNSIEFEYIPSGTPVELTRRIDYTVTDGEDFSLVFSHSVTLATDNSPPDIVDPDGNPIDDFAGAVDEDTSGSFELDVIDPEDDPVILESQDPANGTVVITGGVSFTYTPDPNFFGDDIFIVTVTDQGVPPLSDQVTVTITVNPINDNPVVNPLTIEVDEKTTTSICVTVNDIEGDTHQFTSGIATINGTVVADGTSGDLCFDYTPPIDFQGQDQVEVTICDSDDPTVCGTGIVTITVVDVNEPPIIYVEGEPGNSQTVDAIEDTPKNFCFEVVDLEGDDVSVSSISDGTGGTLTASATEFCFDFVPDPNFNGQSIWEVEVCDNNSPQLCSMVTITINVGAVNDPPVINGTEGQTEYPWSEVVINGGLNITDVDDTDIEGAVITISSNYMINEDEILFNDINGITGVFDVALGTLTLSGTSSLANYTAALNSITFLYTPPVGNPSDLSRQIDFIITDGTDESLLFSQEITFTISNGPPVIVDEGGDSIDNLSVEVSEDADGVFCLLVEDPDGDLLILSNEDALNGTVTLTGGLCFEYVPDTDFYGEDSFIVTVCDVNTPSLCDEVLVTVTINPVNDAPSVDGAITGLDYPWQPIGINSFTVDDVDDSSIESATVSITGNFVPNEDMLEFVSQNNISGDYNATTGVLTLSGSSSLANYGMALSSINFFYNYSGYPSDLSRTVEVTVNDGDISSTILSRAINFNIANSPPDFTEGGLSIDDITLEMDEDTEVEFTLEITDIDNDNVSLTNLTTASSGEAFISGSVSFTVTPEENYNGEITFSVTACDDNTPSLCDDLVVTINILPVNDPPVALRDTLYTKRLAIEPTINLLINDTDIEDDALSANTTLTVLPRNGSASLSSDGTLTYQSIATYRGVDSLTYEVIDAGIPSLRSVGKVIIIIEDDPFTVYQAISPNGDEKNDYWHIEGIDFYPQNQVRLYDRYQNLVFETKGYHNVSNNWKGQANRGLGKGNLPDGTYYYHISLGSEGGTKGGFIFLKND